MTARIELPVYFKVSASDNRIAFCSVAEFSAAADTVFAPHYFLEHLGVEEGSAVKFESINLQPAKSIVLRPHNDLWRPLNQSDHGTRLLSDQLSKLSVLFVGQTIEIETHDRRPAKFDVLEINPSEDGAVSLLHADVELHLVEPVQSADASSFPRLEKEELKGAVVMPGSLVYFSVSVKSDVVAVVSVKPKSGDVDLFASTVVRFPSAMDFEVCSADGIGEKELKLRALDGHETEYVVGVVSETPVEFVARLNQNPLETVAPNSNNEDSAFCENCQKFIPKASFELHSLRCRQLVFHCKLCRVALPLSAKKKHELLMHCEVVCACGTALQRYQIPLHKRRQDVKSEVPKCPLSPVSW